MSPKHFFRISKSDIFEFLNRVRNFWLLALGSMELAPAPGAELSWSQVFFIYVEPELSWSQEILKGVELELSRSHKVLAPLAPFHFGRPIL